MDFVCSTNDTDITVDLGTTADNFVAELHALVTLITATVRSSVSDLSMAVIYGYLLLIDQRSTMQITTFLFITTASHTKMSVIKMGQNYIRAYTFIKVFTLTAYFQDFSGDPNMVAAKTTTKTAELVTREKRVIRKLDKRSSKFVASCSGGASCL